ncbi:MAG: PIN domain-containing protein [Cyanobacteria bacterium P01_C01_bin.38]
MIFTAIYDASVLYPAPLGDFLMWLALTGLFKARWTNQIHDEWIRSVLKKRPDLTLKQLHRTRDLMNANVRDCLVTGYESQNIEFELPDPDDIHVLAAAIHSQANFIITFNLKDFPKKILAYYEVEAIHPDDFILNLLQIDSSQVCQAVQKHRQSLKKPQKTVEEYLDTLNQQGITKSVTAIRQLCDEI